MVNKILLTSQFGNNIFTRSSISNFFRKLNSVKDKKITLDFKDVEFISRSCADEYLKQKKISKKKVIEVNMSNNIYNMFRNVCVQYENMNLPIPFTISQERGLVLA